MSMNMYMLYLYRLYVLKYVFLIFRALFYNDRVFDQYRFLFTGNRNVIYRSLSSKLSIFMIKNFNKIVFYYI